MTRARRALRLLAETVREISILILVFAPLESVFSERLVDVRLLIGLVAVSATFIVCAILVEARD
jgi:hypothetical protein